MKELELVEATHAFFSAWKGWLRSRLPPGERNPTRQLVLVWLARMEPLPMAALRARLGLPKPNVTMLVDALEAEGLITRRASTEDKRATVLRLTAKGRKAARALGTGYDREVGMLFAALGPDAQDALLKALQTLTTAATREP